MKLTKFYHEFKPLSMDDTPNDMLLNLPKEAHILNVGSGSTRLRENIVNLDIENFPNVDVVADAHSLPFEDGEFDCVYCNAVLEHLEKPWIAAAEIQRVLKKGGIAIVVVPFLFPVHDEHDYFRFTFKGLRSLFPELKEIKSGVCSGASQTLAYLLRGYLSIMFENTILEYPAKFAMNILAAPVRYLEGLVEGKPSMFKYAQAVYFIGQKI